MKKMMQVAAGVAALVGAGHVQAYDFSDGDLLLNFRYRTTTSAFGDYNLTIDIGPASTYETAVGQVNLNQFTTSDLNGLTTLGLNGNYGNVRFSAIASLFQGDNTVYATTTRNAASPNYNTAAVAASTPVGLQSSSGLSGEASKINTIGVQAGVFGTGSGDVKRVGDGLANSYHSLSDTVAGGTDGTTANLNNSWAGNIENFAPASFTGASFIRSDLYKYSPSTAGDYLGYFQFNADGTAFFMSEVTAVPEPTTYGLLAGAGLLLVTMRRKLSVKQA